MTRTLLLLLFVFKQTVLLIAPTGSIERLIVINDKRVLKSQLKNAFAFDL